MNRTEHLLTILAEECAEVAQRVSKALRFGLSEIQTGQPYTNAERISHELNDLIAVTTILMADGVINNAIPTANMTLAKEAKIEKYFQISREQKTLEDRT